MTSEPQSSEMPYHKDLAKRTSILPPRDNRSNPYENSIELAGNSSSALILSQDIVVDITEFNCDLVVVIDKLVSASIASLVMSKNSSLYTALSSG